MQVIKLMDKAKILEINNISVILDNHYILSDLSLNIYKKEIIGIIGASGSGKSVLLRTILGLEKHNKGNIKFHIDKNIYSQIGVLFQQGALFSSLSVLENVKVPMLEQLNLPLNIIDELAKLKLALVGLDNDAYNKLPSEISGGMIKRVALARALALDPKIIFLDEPTSGLDPISASQFNILIKNLKETMGITFFMITHDVNSLRSICDRVAVLHKGKIEKTADLETLMQSDSPWIKSYFQSGITS